MSAFQPTSTVYIGTMGVDSGIYRADFDAETGLLSDFTLASHATGCGFLVLHPTKPLLFASHMEGSAGGVAAYHIEADHSLSLINTRLTRTEGPPCHVSLDPGGRVLMASSYAGGSVSSFLISDNGTLSEARSVHQHSGQGSHPERQKAPHPHSAFSNQAGTHAYVLDLGTDEIWIYRINPATGTLTLQEKAPVPGGGMGPRHLVFSQNGKRAYVVNELTPSVSLFCVNADHSLLLDTTIALTSGRGEMSGADIRLHPNGQHVYTSNRDCSAAGHDAMAVLTTTEHPNGFALLQEVSAEVHGPRNFNLDPSGQWLIAGGQFSEDVSVFQIDQKTGTLRFTGRKPAFPGQPICFCFRSATTTASTK